MSARATWPHSVERRFPWLVGAAVVLGVALRVTYVLVVTRHDAAVYDATYYEYQARDMAQGEGFFTDPFARRNEGVDDAPAADHPPLLALVLVPAGLVGDEQRSALLMRLTNVALGAATIASVALLARALAGPVAGLVGAGVAAVDPNLWMADGLIMPETLAGLLAIVVVAGAYRLARDGPGQWLVLGVGAAWGMAVLARAELVALGPLVVLPALWRSTGGDRRRAAGAVVAAAAMAGALVLPWVAFNLARFERPVLVSTSDGLAIRAANCDLVYEGPYLGWAWVFEPCVEPPAGIEQSVWSEQNREAGFDHVADNLGRLPVVIAARLGRAFHLYRPAQTADFTAGEGRPRWAAHLGAAATWALAPAAVAGGLLLRRRGRWVWPLVVPVLVTAGVIALLAGGLPRYRAPAEPAVVVLAAVALARWWLGDPISTARSAAGAPAGASTDPGRPRSGP